MIILKTKTQPRGPLGFSNWHMKELQKLSVEELKKKDREATGDLGIEGGYSGQEDLEDRYATTSGEH